MTREQFISQVEFTQKAFRRFLVALCCGDNMLADDIAQESYIKAYLSCDSLSDPEKFRSWIFKIGYHTFLNHKSSSKLTVAIDDAKEIKAHESSDSGFVYQDLYEALSRIPPKERTSLLLFYMQGYSIKEIAEIEGASQDAVKQHLSRGRKNLRNFLSHNNSL
ncbi:MAG: RNA polymerase sigma factor [Paramuribaculum sp.]|nr:RNA polymerase sigma factor [Paramuribaculum sp.]